MAHLLCTKETIIPVDGSGVRWLDPDADYGLAKTYWGELGQDLRQSTWRQAHEHGYRYAAIVQCERIISLAAVWRFSENAWDAAAVSTLEGYRRRGHAKRVVGFVAAHILDSGMAATCCTRDSNAAMIATAESVGYRRVPLDEVWWTYPKLPEF